MKKTTLWISILTALLLGAAAQAEMITVGGDQTAGTGTLTINQDITFTITTAGSGDWLSIVFDEIVTTDTTMDNVDFSGLEFSINGGVRKGFSIWKDNLDSTSGAVTPNDGIIQANLPSYSLAINDTVTLHAGTGTMTSTEPTFNPWASGDHTMFLATGFGVKMSNDVVPEPATAGLLGISAVVFYALRRIKNFNKPV